MRHFVKGEPSPYFDSRSSAEASHCIQDIVEALNLYCRLSCQLRRRRERHIVLVVRYSALWSLLRKQPDVQF